MAHYHYTETDRPLQAALTAKLSTIFDNLDDEPLLEHIREQRRNTRPGYEPRTMWRAYVASFILNVPHTNALIRRLQDDRDMRHLCGFSDQLPHRSTFNRFIRCLADCIHLVEACSVALANRLRQIFPDLGDEVAVDSTNVRSHCNPDRKPISDPEASWAIKDRPRAEWGREKTFGFKVHMVADVNYGLPLAQVVTTGKRNDSPELPPLIEHTESLYPWFKPSAVMADRGYDSVYNHEYLYQKGIMPIIHIRHVKKNHKVPLYEGVYTKEGVPTCIGQVPMQYIRSHPEKGHLYRCGGCHLKDSNRGGIRYCDTEVWEDPSRDIRRFGVIRRNSPEWKQIYGKRQAIERVFKGQKESRRLERPYVRGLRQIELHAMMSSLTFQATALANILAGRADSMTWMVRKVA